MAARDTGETAVSPSGTSADPPPARPSWEAPAPSLRPAAPPRPAPRAVARPAPTEAASPYYAAAPLPDPPPSATPVYQEEAVQYDLAGNPITPRPSSQTAIVSLPPGGLPVAPPVPFGYSAGTAAPWPPPIGGYAPGTFRNNSGEQDHLPPEIERLRWHWGAFFFPILWTKKHGLTTIAATLAGGLFALRMIRYGLQFVSPAAFLVLCGVYGVAYFGVQLYFGLNGHRIGWRNRHFPGGLDEYFKVQNAWMWWGFGINVTLGVVLPVLAFLGLLSLGLSAPHHSRYGNGYGSGYSRPAAPWPDTNDTTPGDAGTSSPGGN